MGWFLHNRFHAVDLKVQEKKFSKAVCAFQVAQHRTRLVYKNSDFKVLWRIILKNSCAEKNMNACKACAVYKDLLKNLTG